MSWSVTCLRGGVCVVGITSKKEKHADEDGGVIGYRCARPFQ